MTLAEVEQIHGTSVQDWESNKWERNCLGSFANSETVGFTGKDGTEFILGLLDFPGGEDYKQRFRVRSVSLYVQATRTEYDAMVDQLVQRWNMGLKGDSPARPLWCTTTPRSTSPRNYSPSSPTCHSAP
ncbi:hypothetical protein [Xanthomonas campestris]|uniref:Uncharacterized protein n=1 Tax=Xanthomonas campestris pv. papavericola TaxID=487881 RepID=A0AAJ2X6N4_XANCA|nr:hypothetical protein [Xanthomonas campestris]MEC3889799.1 hypothetical protein [Xanthomonas campestris pv. papavericola]